MMEPANAMIGLGKPDALIFSKDKTVGVEWQVVRLVNGPLKKWDGLGLGKNIVNLVYPPIVYKKQGVCLFVELMDVLALGMFTVQIKVGAIKAV